MPSRLPRHTRRPSNFVSDPLLTSGVWRAVREHWIRQRLPCARCHRPIDYDTVPRYWASLDVGHIVDRVRARALGWTDVEINAVGNTQPEHQRCNREAGVRLGNARRQPTSRTARPRPLEADEW